MAIQAAGGGTESKNILDKLSGLRDKENPSWMETTPRLITISSSSNNESNEENIKVDLIHETLLHSDSEGKPYWATL